MTRDEEIRDLTDEEVNFVNGATGDGPHTPREILMEQILGPGWHCEESVVTCEYTG